MKLNNILHSSSAQYINKLYELKLFMKRTYLPPELRDRMLSYYEYRYPKKSYPGREIIRKMSSLLADVSKIQNFNLISFL